jgi:hypothetical protein
MLASRREVWPLRTSWRLREFKKLTSGVKTSSDTTGNLLETAFGLPVTSKAVSGSFTGIAIGRFSCLGMPDVFFNRPWQLLTAESAAEIEVPPLFEFEILRHTLFSFGMQRNVQQACLRSFIEQENRMSLEDKATKLGLG